MNLSQHKDKGRDKNKNYKWMPLCIKDDKLLEKYKTNSTKSEDLKNIKSDALLVYDDTFIKTKIRTYGNKVYNDLHGLNVPEDGVEYGSFTVISIDSLFAYEKNYYLLLYFNNCAYKIVDNEMADYLDDNLFESYEN